MERFCGFHIRLIVTLGLLASLLLEAQALVEGVVQLGVGIGNLLLADEHLEALAQTLLIAVVLGERAHHLRMVEDEGRVDAGRLDELARQLVDHARVGERRRALDVHLLAQPLQELVGLLGVQLIVRRELLAGHAFQLGDHLDAAPGSLPVDLKGLAVLCCEGRLVGAG